MKSNSHIGKCYLSQLERDKERRSGSVIGILLGGISGFIVGWCSYFVATMLF